MLFDYSELKEYVTEDFERFVQMGFTEEQIIPAVLNEYEHGEDYSLTEKVCIHVILGRLFTENGYDGSQVVNKIGAILNPETTEDVKASLGDEYKDFLSDLNSCRHRV